jgi:hypothetical protein
MFDTNAFYPRRLSTISADGENSEMYTPTTMVNPHSNLIQHHPQHQQLLFGDGSMSSSPQQLSYLDATTMAKYDFSYLEDSVSQNSYDGSSPISSTNTTFVNTPMTTNHGGIDFNVFDASQTGSNDTVNYLGLSDFDAYDQYENMAALSFISTADEQFLRNNSQFVKFDY